MSLDCATTRHPDDAPVAAEPDAWLCGPCRRHLARDLRRLPLLDKMLEEATQPARMAGRSRGGGDGLPYNDQVSECRSQLRHDLIWWAQQCAEDRDTIADTSSIAAMCGWLHGCLKWAQFRSWAGDMADVIGASRRRAMALLDPYPARRIPVPPPLDKCPACGEGRLSFVIYGENDKRRSHGECDACDQVWLPEQWLRLGQRILAAAA